MVKRVEAVVRAEKLTEIKLALMEKGYGGMTVQEVKGRGHAAGVVRQWRGREYVEDFLPRVKVEVVVGDDEWQDVVEAITTVARTGDTGDGKIFVSPVEFVVRIRTGETSERALE